MTEDAKYRPAYIVSPAGYIDPQRAEFAKAAMQGLIMCGWLISPTKVSDADLIDCLAALSVEVADKMIDKLKQSDDDTPCFSVSRLRDVLEDVASSQFVPRTLDDDTVEEIINRVKDMT